MVSEHDRRLLEGLRSESGSSHVTADDPAHVARALAEALGAALVAADAHPRPAVRGLELQALARRVRDAERLVAAAVAFEQARATELVAGSTVPAPVPPDLGASPAVRAAEAHLRRQRAAWRVAWWEDALPVPDAASWVERCTLVCLDEDGAVDEGAYATMTAGEAAVIRIVVVSPRRR